MLKSSIFKNIIKKVDLKNGIVGYAIQTGQRSQIFVIDWDNKDISDKSYDFKQKLKDCNTLTINTAGGGHHFIFKYQGKLSNIKNHTHLFGNIDIRNNKGCIYFGDRDDGIYTIENKEVKIQELPDNLLLELHEEIINKTGRKVRQKLDKAFAKARKALQEQGSTKYDGKFGFEEWYADQYAVYAFDPDQKATNFVQSYFKRIVQRLKAFFDIVNKKPVKQKRQGLWARM